LNRQKAVEEWRMAKGLGLKAKDKEKRGLLFALCFEPYAIRHQPQAPSPKPQAILDDILFFTLSH
jgi:hypothetical protein